MSTNFVDSPLVSKAGQQILPENDLRRLHQEISAALLAGKNIHIGEFTSAVFHAIIGRAEKLMARIFGIFATAPDDIRAVIAKDCDWVLVISTKPGDDSPFITTRARQSFRLLQWEIATIARPEELQALRDNIEQDFPSNPGDLAEAVSRTLYLSRLLTQTALEIPINEFVSKSLELSRLTEFVNKQNPNAGIGRGLPDRFLGRAKPAILDWLFSAMIPKVNGPEDLRLLTRTIDALGTEERKAFLSTFHSDDGDVRILFNKAWLKIEQQDAADHESLAQILREAIIAGRQWGCKPWMQAAARLLSTILDERLNRKSEAEDVIANVVAEVGSSPNLDDQMATIAFNSKDYSRALGVWQKTLPGWRADEYHDMQPIFAARCAAVAASNLAQWDVAADLFEQAAHRSERFKQRTLTLGLMADRGYALWRAGQKIQALKSFSGVVEQLETVHNKPEDLKEFALHKFVGQVLYYLSESALANEPWPGMCSQLAPHKDLSHPN